MTSTRRQDEEVRTFTTDQPGELIDAGTYAVRLDDPRVLWTVVRGQVDLFAIRRDQDSVRERWLFLYRANTGDSILGFAPGPQHTVVGRPVRNAQLRRTPVSHMTGLSALAADGAADPNARARANLAVHAMAFSLARGLDGLSERLNTGAAPRKFFPLDDGNPATLDSGQVVRSVDGVVWIRVESGRLRLRGQNGGTRYPGDVFPVSESDWYSVVDPATRIIPQQPRELLDAGRLWPALALHAARMLFLVDRYAEQLLAGDAQALREGTEHDDRLAEAASRALVSVVNGTPGPVRLADVAFDDALMAAVRLVADRLEIKVVAPRIRTDGTSRSDPLTRIAQASRFRTRTLRLEGTWWREDFGPLLAYQVKDGQAVALFRDRRGYAIVEPGAARAQYVTAARAAEIDVDAVTFYRPLPERALEPKELFRFGLFGTRRDAWTLAMTLVFVAGLGLVVPVVTGAVLGTYVPQAQSSLALRACLLVIALAGVSGILTVVQNIALLRLEGRVDSQAQAALWDRLLSLPLAFFGRYSVGELSGVALGISTIREALSGIAITALSALVVGLANLVLLLIVAPLLALVVVGIMIVGSAVSAWCAVLQVRAQRRVVGIEQELSSRVFQLLTGIAKLRVAAAETRAFAQWSAIFARSRRATYSARRIQNVLATFNSVYFLVGALIVFWVMSGPLAGSVSTATFLVFFVAFNQLLASTTQFTGAAIAVLNIVPLAQNIAPVLAATPEARTELTDPDELAGRIEFNHVSFAYEPSAPKVIDDFSLHIEPGEFIAVVGPTGCGKSTLLRLLLAFEQPDTGTILYDDQDLSRLDPTAVRRQCGVVLQSGQVLAGDLLSIIVGTGKYTVEDAWAAARMAGLGEDIEAMPMGMHTVVSDGGGSLSGGQRQRLMIARALISRPRIIFFDEATSALDNSNQQIIANSTRSLRSTRIVIAHRLTTVIDADRIVVLDGGRIVQTGTYQELYADEAGLFRSLVRRQVV